MQHETGDETADFLLRQLRFLRRVGTPNQKRDATKWETIVRTHAEPADVEMAASFATRHQPNGSTNGSTPHA